MNPLEPDISIYELTRVEQSVLPLNHWAFSKLTLFMKSVVGS